jgi:hypothetical protein
LIIDEVNTSGAGVVLKGDRGACNRGLARDARQRSRAAGAFAS